MSEERKPAILCPDCGKLVSADAEQCIHCGRKNPGMWGLGTALRKMHANFGFREVVTSFCIGLYIVALLLDPNAIFQVRGLFSLLSPSHESLQALGMTGAVAIAQDRWWTLITAIFLHGGLPHIFFNLMWVRQLAPEVEELFGASRLILIFIFSGVLGFIFSSFAGNYFTVGASGSIFGLMGAMIYYGRARGGSFGANVYRQTLQWAVILFLFGIFWPRVDNWAHGGGFVGGYIAAMLLGFSEQKRENFRIQTLTLSTIVVTVLSFVIILWELIF